MTDPVIANVNAKCIIVKSHFESVVLLRATRVVENNKKDQEKGKHKMYIVIVNKQTITFIV